MVFHVPDSGNRAETGTYSAIDAGRGHFNIVIINNDGECGTYSGTARAKGACILVCLVHDLISDFGIRI